MVLSQLENIIDDDNLSFRKNCGKLVAGIVSEYALSCLKIQEKDVKIFPKIRDYYISREILTDDLLISLCQYEETEKIIRLFPETTRNQFDRNEWIVFLSECYWENENNNNRFYIKGTEIKTEQMVLVQIEENQTCFMAEYSRIGDEYFFACIGNQNIQIKNANPYFKIKKIVTDKAADVELGLSDDKFFNCHSDLQRLDDTQRSAVRADMNRNLVILAGAGSGKTTTLLARYAYLHAVKNVPLRKILLVTFTREAASKLRTDGNKLLKSVYSANNTDVVPDMDVRTFDSLFKSIVDLNFDRFGFERKPSLGVNNKKEYIDFVNKVIKDNGLQDLFSRYQKTEYLIREVEGYLSGVQGNLINFDLLVDLLLEEQIKKNVIYNFVYLNLIVKNVISEPNSWLKEDMINKYQAILVDEFQDISRLQNDTIGSLYNERVHFTFVGDDDQAIYEWRGADSDIIKEISAKADSQVVNLLINYRNNPNIVNAGNHILNMIEGRAKKNLRIEARKEDGPKIRVMDYDAKYANLVNEIDKLLLSGREAEKIYVLCRMNNERQAIYEALKASKIKVKENEIQVELNDQYKIFKALIFILSDYDVPKQCKILSDLLGISYRYTERKIARVIRGEEQAPEELIEAQGMSSELRFCQSEMLANLARHFVIHYQELYGEDNDDELEALNEFEEYCRNMDAPWPIEHVQLYNLFNLFERERFYSNERSTAKGITVSTIHKAKGLECEVVFITGLNSGVFPNTESIEKRYNAKCREIENFKDSRQNYDELKKTVPTDSIGRMVAECDTPAFRPGLEENFETMKRRIISNQTDVMILSADGIEIFIETYKNQVASNKHGYDIQRTSIQKEILHIQSKIESIEDQIKHQNEYLHGLKSEDNIEELDEGNLQLKDLEAELVEYKKEKEEKQKELVKHERRVQKYNEYTSNLTAHYRRCLRAKGYLDEMAKVERAEMLKKELERQKVKRINEERRNYYVAFTRAQQILYLCYTKDQKMSEFITCIPDKYRANYLSLTKEEQREVQRLHNHIVKKIKNDERDESIDSDINYLIDKSHYKKATQELLDEYMTLNPEFRKLSGEAKIYFEKAIRFMSLSSLIDIPMETEFVHNIQRMAETLLSEFIGPQARPYLTSEVKATEIAEDIREILIECITASPSQDYIVKLLSRKANGNAMKVLKSLGIEHYVVRSGKYDLNDTIKKTWSNIKKLDNAEEFCAAAVDLSNIRNKLIHPDKEESVWMTDMTATVLDKAKVVVRECAK